MKLFQTTSIKGAGKLHRFVSWLAVGVLLLIVAPSFAAGCDPSKQCCAGGQSGGATCDGSGVATQGNTSGTKQGGGNPIDLLSGNKYQREVDLPALPGVLGLEIVRHYNSLASGPNSTLGPLGRGWRLSYETRLLPRGGTLVISEADGSVLTFGRSPQDARRYTGAGATHGYVVAEPAGHTIAWRWHWPNGRRLDFNADGTLAQIAAPTGEVLRLSYDDQGWLIKVIDPQGRSLHLVYLDKKLADGKRFAGVTHIDSPVGRFVYHYGSPVPKGSKTDPKKLLANLVKVDLPTHYDADSKLHAWSNVGHTASSISRSYHYEDPQHPTLLSGISVSGMGSDGQLTDQRLARYRYDAQGRGVYSQRGDEQVALDFSMPGLTTLTDAHGRRTLYRHQTIAGEPRLTEARGPGCASCSPGNMRYRYDRLGRLIEQMELDVHGKPVRASRTTRDGYGRVLAVDEVDFVANKTTRRVRYEYALGDPQAPSDRPVLIARPSVVAGKEYQVRIRYNTVGQPTVVVDIGYSPLDGQGRVIPGAATLIQCTTRYQYRTINGRSLLAEVDGPLSGNATRLEYDARGDYLTRIITAGRVDTRIVERDPAGRPLRATVDDGVRRLQEQSVFSPQGQLEQLTHSGWWLSAQGKVDRGSRQGQTLSARYGATGMLNQLDEGAIRQILPAEAARQKAAEPSPILVQTTARDVWQRTAPWQDAQGTVLLRAIWGSTGSAAQDQVLRFVTGAAEAERQLDDFGHVVAIRNPQQGWQSARYDAADRLLESTDARGARQVLHYNEQGQLIVLERFAPGQHQPEETLRYHYRGTLRVEEIIIDRYGTRSQHSDYDALGREISVRYTIALAGRRPVSFRLEMQLDDTGRRTRSTLSDGDGHAGTVDAGYDKQGRVSRLDTPGWLPRWLGGGRALVKSIDWQQIHGYAFAARITHGDGWSDEFETKQVSEGEGPAGNGPANTESASNAAPTGPGEGHDAAGLPHTLTTRAGPLQLQWDAAGRLARSETADHGSSINIYDARGRRIARLDQPANGTAQLHYFMYDGVQLIGEANGDGKLVRRYVYLGYRPVTQLELQATDWWAKLKHWLFGPVAAHLHTTKAGRVAAVSGDHQQVLWEEGRPSQYLQPLRDVGQYADEPTGLIYHGARFFDARSGRFVSPDPSGVADALGEMQANLLLDLYAYAGGDPAEYFDPDGAAKIRYYAIDDGKRLDPNKLPDSAHWAFTITDIAGQDGKMFLYDRGGSYFATGTNFQLFEKVDAADVLIGLQNTYSGEGGYYSPAQFERSFADGDAKKLIKDMTGLNLGGCSASYKLPMIDLGTQGVLDPTFATYKVSKKGRKSVKVLDQANRIVTCDANASPQQIRIKRLRKAIEAHEVSDDDCALSLKKYGDHTGCAARTWNPAAGADGLRYQPASYGWPQYTFSKLFEALGRISDATLFSIGLTREDVKAAMARGDKAAAEDRYGLSNAVGKSWYYRMNPAARGNAVGANQDLGWSINGAQFTKETGLNHDDYIRIVNWHKLRFRLDEIRKDYHGACQGKRKKEYDDCVWGAFHKVNLAEYDQTMKLIKNLGASEEDVRPYTIKNIQNEARSGFYAEAVLNDSKFRIAVMGVFVNRAVDATLGDANYDVLLRSAAKKYSIDLAKPITQTQELLVARKAMADHNGDKGNTYSGMVEPIWNKTVCLAKSGGGSSVDIKINPLRVLK